MAAARLQLVYFKYFVFYFFKFLLLFLLVKQYECLAVMCHTSDEASYVEQYIIVTVRKIFCIFNYCRSVAGSW